MDSILPFVQSDGFFPVCSSWICSPWFHDSYSRYRSISTISCHQPQMRSSPTWDACCSSQARIRTYHRSWSRRISESTSSPVLVAKTCASLMTSIKQTTQMLPAILSREDCEATVPVLITERPITSFHVLSRPWNRARSCLLHSQDRQSRRLVLKVEFWKGLKLLPATNCPPAAELFELGGCDANNDITYAWLVTTTQIVPVVE